MLSVLPASTVVWQVQSMTLNLKTTMIAALTRKKSNRVTPTRTMLTAVKLLMMRKVALINSIIKANELCLCLRL